MHILLASYQAFRFFCKQGTERLILPDKQEVPYCYALCFYMYTIPCFGKKIMFPGCMSETGSQMGPKFQYDIPDDFTFKGTVWLLY
jgi:hypothetical protein